MCQYWVPLIINPLACGFCGGCFLKWLFSRFCMHSVALYSSVIIGQFKRDAGTQPCISINSILDPVRGKQPSNENISRVSQGTYLCLILFLESQVPNKLYHRSPAGFPLPSCFFFNFPSLDINHRSHVGSAYHQACHGGRYVHRSTFLESSFLVLIG